MVSCGPSFDTPVYHTSLNLPSICSRHFWARLQVKFNDAWKFIYITRIHTHWIYIRIYNIMDTEYISIYRDIFIVRLRTRCCAILGWNGITSWKMSCICNFRTWLYLFSKIKIFPFQSQPLKNILFLIWKLFSYEIVEQICVHNI